MTFKQSVNCGGTLHPPDGGLVELQPIDIMHQTSRFDEAALIEMEALADATPEELREITVEETGISVTVNGTLIGSGMLNDLSVDGEGVVEVTAVDCVRNLHQNEVGEDFHATDVIVVLERIFEAAGIPEADQDEDDWIAATPGYHLHVGSPAMTDVPGEIPDGEAGQAMKVDKNFNDTACVKALEEVLQEFRWYWFANEKNIIEVTASPDPQEHQLEFITETSAGKQTPPYQRVVVYGGTNEQSPPGGDGSTAEGTRRHLMSRAPVKGEAGPSDGEPIFEHTDKSLKTQAKAEATAKRIYKELQSQQRSGHITAIGNPEIRPFDAVYMPDEMGGEGYGVSSIEHIVNGDDGFTTEIGVGGLVDRGPN